MSNKDTSGQWARGTTVTFVQNRRCHYQSRLDIDPRPIRDMASSDFTELALVA
jgi:hypothetical protein